MVQYHRKPTTFFLMNFHHDGMRTQCFIVNAEGTKRYLVVTICNYIIYMYSVDTM